MVLALRRCGGDELCGLVRGRWVLPALLVTLAEMFVQLDVGIFIKTAESSSRFGARLVDYRLYVLYTSFV